MKKKLITIISTFLAVVFGVSMFSGCDLLETDNKKDMEQVVAEVNIGKDADSLNSMFKTIFGADYALDEGVAGKLGDIVTTDNVYKRDLVAYFVNYGYNYVNGYVDGFRVAKLAVDAPENPVYSRVGMNPGQLALDADGNDLALLGLFLGGVRDVDATLDFFFHFGELNENAGSQRFNIHVMIP